MLAAVSSPPQPVGRGAAARPNNPHASVDLIDDLEQVARDADFLAARRRVATSYGDDDSRSIVNRNDSPDLAFRWSVNPYRGCAHGCSYCYARPSHEFLGSDAGLGFESEVLVKRNAPRLLAEWLQRPGWDGEPIAFSGVTDCYQPAERRFRVTRACLEVAAERRQPIAIVTKNALVTRDLDLLASLAEDRAAVVAVSLTTLDAALARKLEPRTSAPTARLRAIRELSDAGIPVHLLTSPMIPGLNDHEAPRLLEAGRDAGARSASYTLLRLPGSVREVFLDWLRRNEPNRAPRVEALLRGARRGRWYDARFGHRMRGEGAYAAQIARNHRVFTARYGLERTHAPLSAEAFLRAAADPQRRLF